MIALRPGLKLALARAAVRWRWLAWLFPQDQRRVIRALGEMLHG